MNQIATGADTLSDQKAGRQELEYALEIKGLCKRFKRSTAVGRTGYTTLKSALLATLRSCTSRFTKSTKEDASAKETSGPVYTEAIKDLTVRIPRGSSVGIIGRNGSGKSTLLKLITGIYKPDGGSVSVEGRVAALIELGAGFHPDFSGRENVYLGGIMYGLSRKQIDERFDEIVAFAELEHVIDDPVRTYSSGMFMRLGFSLAIHVDPDVLLIDEVLAVGDAGFTAKCKERITKLRRMGKTLLLVSHDLDSVERWCDEAVWLHEGVVADRGEPRRVIDAYREFLERKEEEQLFKDESEREVANSNSRTSGPQAGSDASTEGGQPESHEIGHRVTERWGGREFEITGACLLKDGEPHLLFHPDDQLKIQFTYTRNEDISSAGLVMGVAIHRTDGVLVFGTNTDLARVEMPAELSEEGVIAIDIERLGLLEGEYRLDIAFHKDDGYPYDYHRGILHFRVKTNAGHVGVVAPRHQWDFTKAADESAVEGKAA